MAARTRYECPVCKTPLSRAKFDAVFGVWKKQKAHIEHLEQVLRQSRQERAVLVREAVQRAREATNRKVQRQLFGKDRQIEKLNETIRQLQQGTTSQEAGLADERRLFKELQERFRSDGIKHTGKNGDILHDVKFEKRRVGRIVYECKRYTEIKLAHIRQAYRAKQSNRADEAVLVTTGKRRGFDGFDRLQGVFVIAPHGVLPFVEALRNGFLEIAKERRSRKQRALLAQRLTEYLTSQAFRGPLQDVMERTKELWRLLGRELSEHHSQWQQRIEHYQRLYWDAGTIRNAIDRVFHGEGPAQLPPPSRVGLPLREEVRLPVPLLTQSVRPKE